MTESSPSFKVWLQCLSREAQLSMRHGGFTATYMRAAFNSYIDGATKGLTKEDKFFVPRMEKDIIPYLENEFSILGLDTLSDDTIKNTRYNFASSSAFGWHVPAPNENVFIRYNKNKAENSQRPRIIAGCNSLREKFLENTFSFVETLPYIDPLHTVEMSTMDRYSAIEFTSQLIDYIGFEGSALRRKHMSDFGIRYFNRQENSWQVCDHGPKALAVPFMLDTEDLEGGCSLEDQRCHLQDLMNHRRLETMGSTHIPLEMKKSFIECYLAFDAVGGNKPKPA